MKSPINWFGGKYYLSKNIVSLFPKHKKYVEVFGGAGHTIFRKPPSPIEVYNDIDSNLYNFFSILRNERLFEKFSKSIQLTPFSQEEFLHCLNNIDGEKDIVEKTRMWYVLTMQSRNTLGKDWTYTKNTSRRGMSKNVSQWLGKVDDNLPDAVERFREIQVEKRDYLDCIKIHSGEETLFYLDPPYIHSTRSTPHRYEHDMEKTQHEEMVACIIDNPSKIILSGYDSDIYNPLTDSGWEKVCVGKSAGKDEVVWIKK